MNSEYDPNCPMVGDLVKVVVQPHMEGHDTGIVRQVVGGALGIEFDSAKGEVHHWYVASEVMVTKSSKPKKPTTDDAGMRLTGSNGSVISLSSFPHIREYRGLWAIDLEFAQSAFSASVKSPQSSIEMVPAKGGKSIAYLKLSGVMMKGVSAYGGTSTIKLRNDVRAAAKDPNVQGILLGIDSPGGTVAGTADLAAEVKSARKSKPVWAHISDLGASAAYWVASQASAIYANTPTALVGSIGTLQTIYDYSQATESAGIKTHVFRTGPLKGLGTPGAPVTEEQISHMQTLVNEMQTHFDAAVMKGRGFTAKQLESVRTGGVFPAAEAQTLRLIDGIRSLDATVEALSAVR